MDIPGEWRMGGDVPASDGLPADVLHRVRDLRAAQREADVHLMLLACEWADRHPLLGDDATSSELQDDAEARADEQRRIAAGWLARDTARPGDPGSPVETVGDYVGSGDPESLGEDPWVPLVDWRAFAPFAAAMGFATATGERMVKESLFLRHRMPRLWQRVLGGEVETWRARRVASVAWRQPADVVAVLDVEVTPRAHSIGVSGLDRLIDDILLRLRAEERELDQAGARDTWHVSVHPDPTGSGSTEIEIRADRLDAAALDRACSAIAEILGRRQRADGVVPDPLGARRASALGILADPALALAMLQGADEQTGAAGLSHDRPLAPGISVFVHLDPAALTGREAVVRAGVKGPRGSGGVLRSELAQAVAEWCGKPAAQVQVHPVIDLTTHAASTSQTPTAQQRRRSSLRRPTCVFPWCGRPSVVCDADHCVPAGQDGPTCDCNLHPLCRSHHRLKTHAAWSYTPLDVVAMGLPETVDDGHPGPAASWLWRSPHGHSYLVDGSGTRDVTTRLPTKPPAPPRRQL